MAWYILYILCIYYRCNCIYCMWYIVYSNKVVKSSFEYSNINSFGLHRLHLGRFGKLFLGCQESWTNKNEKVDDDTQGFWDSDPLQLLFQQHTSTPEQSTTSRGYFTHKTFMKVAYFDNLLYTSLSKKYSPNLGLNFFFSVFFLKGIIILSLVKVYYKYIFTLTEQSVRRIQATAGRENRPSAYL